MKEVKLGSKVKFDITANGHILPGELKEKLGVRGYEKWLSLDGQKAKVTAVREQNRYDIRFACGYTIESISVSHFFGYVDPPEPIEVVEAVELPTEEELDDDDTAGETHDELDKVDADAPKRVKVPGRRVCIRVPRDSDQAALDVLEDDAEAKTVHNEEVFDSAAIEATDEANETTAEEKEAMRLGEIVDSMATEAYDEPVPVSSDSGVYEEPACTEMPVFCTVCPPDEEDPTTRLRTNKQGFMVCGKCGGSYGRMERPGDATADAELADAIDAANALADSIEDGTAKTDAELEAQCKHEHVTVDAGSVKTCSDCQMTQRNNGAPWMPGIGVVEEETDAKD